MSDQPETTQNPAEDDATASLVKPVGDNNGSPAPEQDTPTRVVLLPNSSRPLFPNAMAPFSINDIEATHVSMKEYDAVLGVVQTVDPDTEEIDTLSDIFPVGLTARITKRLEEEPDSEVGSPQDGLSDLLTRLDTQSAKAPLNLLLKGGRRFVVEKIVQTTPYLLAEVTYPEDQVDPDDEETKALAMALMADLRHLVKKSPLFDKDLHILTPPIPLEEAGKLADMAAILTSAKRERMQDILAEFNVKERLSKALLMVKEELDLVGLQHKIHKRIEDKVNRQQHDFFMREQLKAIKKELGLESDPKSLDIQRFKKRLEVINCPEEVESVIGEELEKLSLIETNSPEFNISRTYLDWLTGLPWGVMDEEPLDLTRAQRILEADHYGLEDVKERIVEYLAVHKLKGGDPKGSILCLTGPPGVGKTSMGKSIARTLGRQFFRFSLGGMRDEAEIKGHRRTYVGAMPGKIIQALKRVGTANPVIMLDEIDKLASSYQGDPSSALLEVLDPEQNHQFLDHYLDVRFDLSNVFFVATANVMDTIPRALLDRMEIIRLSGYIEQEKVTIGRKYLLPKQLEAHGIDKTRLNITAAGLRAITRGWAREAGVRKMEQQIAKVCRKVATRVATNPDAFEPVKIASVDDLKPFLGEPKIREEALTKGKTPGIAVGLAWTSRGGATLEVEAISIHSKKGGFKQTGQLGNVMVESTGIAYSYISSRADEFGIADDYFASHTIHMHVPAGATPKDGPSAGVTMGCALISLALNKPIKPRLGMTGELTLTGRVLPVGGIKEKLIAARRQGLKEVILPAANERDLVELPDHIKKGLTFHLVHQFDDVLRLALPGVLGGRGS
ncbi:MAG: endopeptidase La [Leptospirillia bacterium]